MPRRSIHRAPPRDELIPSSEELVPFGAVVLAHRASISAKRSAEYSEALRQLEAAHVAPEHALEQWHNEGGSHVPRKPAHPGVLRF